MTENQSTDIIQHIILHKPIENPVLRKYIKRWMFNNSPDDLGIIRFGFDLFPNLLNPKYGVADWVRPTMFKILRYSPGMSKIDRAWAVCTSREYSKSTWIAVILPLYFILVGQYGIYWKDQLLPEADYIRVRGKNQDRAEEKLDNIISELSSDIVYSLFGNLQPSIKEVRDKKLKNKARMAILKNTYIIQALGLNVPSRGLLIRGRRPKLDIDDDVETKDNVKTVGMRKNNAVEILGEQFGGIVQDGLTIYIGNYVHKECMMAKLQKETSGWNRLFFQATFLDKDGVERSGWAKKFSVEYMRALGEWYRNQPDLGGYKIFMMEYYNKIISDKDYVLKEVNVEYKRINGNNYVKIIDELGISKLFNVHIVVSGDPAISDKDRTSNGAVTVTAFASNKQRYVLDCMTGKLDNRDRFVDNDKRPTILARTPEELKNIRRIGMVEQMARFVLTYHADGFVIENAGQQLAWYNDVVDLLGRLGIRIPGLPYHPVDDKIYKLETGLLNHFVADEYNISNTCSFKKAIKEQIDTFPESTLDLLDTLFNAEKMARFPIQSEFTIYNMPIEDNSTEDPFDDIKTEAWMLVG